jgi:hypothetical protein
MLVRHSGQVGTPRARDCQLSMQQKALWLQGIIYNILIGRVDCRGMMQNSPDPPCRRDFCAENLPESRRSLNYKNKSEGPQRRDPVRMMVNREQPIESPSFGANLPVREPSRSAAPVNPGLKKSKPHMRLA